MSRTHRLFDLLQILRRHRQPVTAAALAAESGVSRRTIYRDVAALQALGAEIEGEAGLGYVLKPGFLLPPLMFTAEEIEALGLGLKWAARRTDPQLSEAAQGAIAKIGAVLPADLRDRIEDDALVVGPGWDRPQPVELSLLRRALNEERKLAIVYCDRAGARTRRVIWPAAIGFFESARVLVAWCELRQGFRNFRTDRIEAAELQTERTPRRRKALVREWRRTLLTETDSMAAYAAGTSAGGTPASEAKRENAMSAEIVLYTNPQSRGGIAHWMLEEVGQPYRVELLKFETMHSPDYLAINPMGKVPAITHRGDVVTETAAICAYLADAFPEAGLAPAPEHRSAYYRWLFFAAGCLEPAVTNRSVGWNPPPDMQRRFGYGSYEAVMDTLAGALRGRTYVAGDRFSAADVYLGAQLGWGMQFGTIGKRPEFEAYCEGLLARPAALRAQERAEKLASQAAWADA